MCVHPLKLILFADTKDMNNSRKTKEEQMMFGEMVENWWEYAESLGGRDTLIGLWPEKKTPMEDHTPKGAIPELTLAHSRQHMEVDSCWGKCDRCTLVEEVEKKKTKKEQKPPKPYNLKNGTTDVGILGDKIFVIDFDGPKHQTDENRDIVVNELTVMIYLDIAQQGRDEDISCPENNYKKLHDFLEQMQMPRESTAKGFHHFFELPDDGDYSHRNETLTRTTAGIKATIRVENNRVVALLQHPSMDVISERQSFLDALFLLTSTKEPQWGVFEPGRDVTEEDVATMHENIGAGTEVGQKRDRAGTTFKPLSLPIDFLAKTATKHRDAEGNDLLTRGIVCVAPSVGKQMILAPWDVDTDGEVNHILTDDNPMTLVLESVTWSGTKKGTKGRGRSSSSVVSAETHPKQSQIVACLETTLRLANFKGDFRLQNIQVGETGGGFMSFDFALSRVQCPLCNNQHDSNHWSISWTRSGADFRLKSFSVNCVSTHIPISPEFTNLVTPPPVWLEIPMMRCDSSEDDSMDTSQTDMKTLCPQVDMEKSLAESPDTFRIDQHVHHIGLFDLTVKQKLNQMLQNISLFHDNITLLALQEKKDAESEDARNNGRAFNPDNVKLKAVDIELAYNDTPQKTRRFADMILEFMRFIEKFIVHVKGASKLTVFKVTRDDNNEVAQCTPFKDLDVLKHQVFVGFQKFPVFIDSFSLSEDSEINIKFNNALVNMSLFDFWFGSGWGTLKENVYALPSFVDTYNCPFSNGKPMAFNQNVKPPIWDIALNQPESFDYEIIRRQFDAILNVGCSGNTDDFDNLIGCVAHLVKNLMRPNMELTYEQKIRSLQLQQIILFQGEEATGKTTCLRDLVIKALQLTSLTNSNLKMNEYCGDFNSEIEGCVFAFVDEIGKGGKNKTESATMADNIKRIMTSTHRTVRKMHKDAYTAENLLNIFGCCERTEDITLFEPGSRRILTIRTNTDKKGDWKYWKELSDAAAKDAYSVTLIRYLLQFQHPDPNWMPGNLTSQGCVDEYCKRLESESMSIQFIAHKLVQQDEFKAEFWVGNETNHVLNKDSQETFVFSFLSEDCKAFFNPFNPKKLKQCIQHYHMESCGTKVNVLAPTNKEFNEMKDLFKLGQGNYKNDRVLWIPPRKDLLDVLKRKYRFTI